MQGKQVCAWQW